MLSIVIPVYNSARSIEKAITSARYQAEVSELILVDDGSSDSSLLICECLAKKYKNISLLKHPFGEHRGANASRNLGLFHSKNEWVSFLDADDYYLENRFADLDKLLLKNSNASVICSACMIESHLGRLISAFPFNNVEFALLNGGSSLGKTSSIIWKKMSLFEVGGFNSSLSSSQEYDLMFRLYQRGFSIFIDASDPKTVICETGTNRISNQSGNILGHNWINLRREMISSFENKISFNKAETQLLFSRIIDVLYRMIPDGSIDKTYKEFYGFLMNHSVEGIRYKLRMRNLLYSFFGFSRAEKIFDKIRWLLR